MIVTDFAEGDKTGPLPTARTLERFLAAAAAALPLRGQVTVLLTDDRGIRRLNKTFRQKNKATDVLSFPAAVPGDDEEGDAWVAGDIAISVDTAARQALAEGHSLGAELKVLMLHGLLHLAGFDHEADKGEMATRELELRRKFSLPGGLIERSEKPARTVKAKAPRSKRSAGKKTVSKPANSKAVKKKAVRV